MLKIKVDDCTFYLSHRTLDRFPQTKLYRMLMGDDIHSNFIEKKNSYYIIDADPLVFSTFVRLTRGAIFWDDHMNDCNKLSELCLLLDVDIGYLKSLNITHILNNSPSYEEVNHEGISCSKDDENFGDMIFDRIHSTSNSIFQKINKKTVIRSRKIELDTHDMKINL